MSPGFRKPPPIVLTRLWAIGIMGRLKKQSISKLLAILNYVKCLVANLAPGEVSEWFMVPLSKSGLRV